MSNLNKAIDTSFSHKDELPKHASSETTAALAQEHEKDSTAAKIMSKNASQEQTVAEQAARVARELGPSFTGGQEGETNEEKARRAMNEPTAGAVQSHLSKGDATDSPLVNKTLSAYIDTSDKVSGTASDATNYAKDTANVATSTAKDASNNALGTATNVANAAKDNVNSATAIAKDVSNKAYGTAADATNYVKGSANAAATTTKDASSKAYNTAVGATNYATDTANVAASTTKDVSNRASETTANATTAAKDNAVAAGSATQSVAGTAYETAANASAVARDTVYSASNAAYGTAANATNVAKDTYNAATTKVAEVANTVVPANATTEGKGIVGTLQDTASAAVTMTGEYYQAAKDTAAPTINKIVETAQGYISGQGAQPAVKPTNPLEKDLGVPATSAPLESGKHQIDGPYPDTKKIAGGGAEVAAVGQEPPARN